MPAPREAPASSDSGRPAIDPESPAEADAGPAEALRSRLREVFRRLYLGSSDERRPAILVELMSDAEWPLRELGFELAQRELSAGNRLGPSVVEASLDRLSSPDARTRGLAALLVSRLAPPAAGDRVGAALIAETDTTAAAALLRAAARWPESVSADAVVRWMTPGSSTFGAATEAMWLVYAPEGVAGPWRDAVLIRLRAASDAELGADGMRLLVSLGSERDRRRIEGLLVSKSPAIRQATAAAATLSADTAQALITAAVNDESLFDPAIRAIVRHHATAETLAAATRLPAASEAVRLAGLRRLSDEAPLLSVVSAASQDRVGPADADALLSPIVESGTRASEMTPALRAEAAVRLAEVRLVSGRPEAALAALNAGGAVTDEGPTASTRYRLTRSVALCLLGQWDDAAAAAGDETGIAAAASRAAALLGNPAFEVRAVTAMKAARERQNTPASVPVDAESRPLSED
ncbi:MAG: hypothetical protein AAF235_01065 [Planctomycetota bacterium]